MKKTKRFFFAPFFLYSVMVFYIMTFSACFRASTTQPQELETYGFEEDMFKAKPIIYRVNVNSEPSGARVYLDDVLKGSTPLILEIKTEVRKVYKDLVIKNRITGQDIQRSSYPGKYYLPLAEFVNHINIAVYKEGYKKQIKRFEVNDHNYLYNLFEYFADKNPIVTTNWAAFLEKVPGADIDLDLKLKVREPK